MSETKPQPLVPSQETPPLSIVDGTMMNTDRYREGHRKKQVFSTLALQSLLFRMLIWDSCGFFFQEEAEGEKEGRLCSCL